MTHSDATRTRDGSAFFPRHMSSFGIALSLFAVCLAGLFLFAQPQGLVFGAASDRGDDAEAFAPLFGLPAVPNAGPTSSMKILAGINGETAQRGSPSAGPDEIVSAAAFPHIEPAALGLSGGRCLTLTSKTGQTFAFRIVGAQPASRKTAAGDGAMELIVASCDKQAEPIVKVVIEPEDRSGEKPAARERNL